MIKYTNLSILLLIAGSVCAAGPVEWMPVGADDLRIESLPASVPAAPPSRHAESEPVRFAWPLEIDRSAPAPSGPAMESRQYWVDTNGLDIQKGLKLPLSSAGAIVRISALHADSGLMLDAAGLQVDIDGSELPVTESGGGIRLVTGRDLQAQGMSVPTDTLAFQLPEQGSPRLLNLQLAGAPADQPMVVHVFEPRSEWFGTLSAARHDYLAGQSIALDVALSNGDQRFAAQSVQAVLVSPDADQAWPLELSSDGLGLRGVVPQELPTSGPGLYEVHAYLEGRQGDTLIRRDIKLALGIGAATARLDHSASASMDRGLTIDFGVEVVTAGRFQMSAQVWGTDASGELRPLAMTQSAAVLAPGANQLQVEVPSDLLQASGLVAPFEVRGIELRDQGRMSLLETRHAGLVIGSERAGLRPGSEIEY